MYKRSEGFFSGYKDLKIFYQAWNQENGKGSVIILHGQGEHSECYQRVTEFFRNDDWNFYAMDMRGHGRSEGKRGYAESFNDYGRDYEIFLRLLFSSKIQKGPVVLLAHSMGALIQLKFLTESYDEFQYPLIKAQVCSGPLLGVSVPVPQFKDIGSELLARIWPELTMWNELDNTMVTRDPDIIREFESDPLRHEMISSRVYLGFKENFQKLPAKAGKIKLPTLFQLAEKDQVVSTSAAREFFEKLGSSHKKLIVYGDSAKHELYNDIIRDQVFSDLKNFLDEIKSGG